MNILSSVVHKLGQNIHTCNLADTTYKPKSYVHQSGLPNCTRPEK